VNLSSEKTIHWISDDAAAALDLGALDIGPRPTESASARRASGLPPSSLKRLSLLAVAGCLLGVAWLAGSASLHRTASGQLAETGQSTRSAADAPKADLDAINAAQSLSTEGVAGLGNATLRPNAAKTDGRPGISEVSDKVSPSGQKSADKVHTAGGQPDPVGIEIAALLAAAPVAARKASPPPVAARRTHDAFDPAKNPNAPGAPRPLGTLSRTVTAMNASAKQPSASIAPRRTRHERDDAFDPAKNPSVPGVPRPLGTIARAATANNASAEY
jgi:hypothetical protein